MRPRKPPQNGNCRFAVCPGVPHTPRLIHKLPAYRLHKASGRAVVTIGGRDHYLGVHGGDESRREYDRLIGEWLVKGRELPAPPSQTSAAMTVTELIVRFVVHAKNDYRRPDGTQASEFKNLKDAFGPLRHCYGHTPAAEFGPIALKTVRQEMIRRGWCRTYINKQVRRVKYLFGWGVENELVPPSVHHGLQAVVALKAGRSEARESEPVKPVSREHVDAVLPLVGRQVAAMIRLQHLTGMRPGEVIAMRPVDIDTSEAEMWVYRPRSHKTQHHGHAREVFLGRQARDLIGPFLSGRSIDRSLFSPAEAVAERRAEQHRTRRTPASCGNNVGTHRVARPKRKPRDTYSVASYGRAIKRACDKAGVPHWHPHQLRHAAATEFRRLYGVEVAQVMLGHSTLTATQVYAERDLAKAKAVMAQVG